MPSSRARRLLGALAASVGWTKVKVSPGPEGLRSFQAEVRRLLRLQDDQEFEISFECKVPGDVSKMELKGMTSYDAGKPG
ncbi:predicted protein, partial [Haematococcus lacustris]